MAPNVRAARLEVVRGAVKGKRGKNPTWRHTPSADCAPLRGYSSVRASGSVFLLAAGRTLLTQDHVRIDVLSSRFSTRTQSWIEVFGLVAFLFPLVAVVITLSMPLVSRAFVSGEVSNNAGGLVRWPVLALMPLGFALLGLQGLSELIKRVGYLLGRLPAPTRAGRGNNTPAPPASAPARPQGSP